MANWELAQIASAVRLELAVKLDLLYTVSDELQAFSDRVTTASEYTDEQFSTASQSIQELQRLVELIDGSALWVRSEALSRQLRSIV